MSVRHIRKNDMVMATAGENRGKTGKVLQVVPSRGRALVEGLNLVRKHLRRSQERPQGGIVDRESPMPLASLMLHCPACKKGVRIKRVRESDKSIRKCRKCGHTFDV